MEVGVPVGVAMLRPARPELIDPLVQGRIGTRRPGPDARADEVVHQHRHGTGGQRVVTDEIAHPVAQEAAGGGDLASAAVPVVRQPSVRRPFWAAS